MAIDKAAKVRYNCQKRESCQPLFIVKVAYTARDNDVVVASLHKGGQVVLDSCSFFSSDANTGEQHSVSDEHLPRPSPGRSCTR